MPSSLSHIRLTALRFLAVLLFFGLLDLLFRPAPASNTDTWHYSRADSIVCNMVLDGGIASNVGRGEGFNYDMLGYFGEHVGKQVAVARPADILGVWDSLMVGSVDVIVCEKDAIPERVEDKVVFSVEMRKGVVWVMPASSQPLVNEINFWFDSFSRSRIYSRLVSKYYRSYNVDKFDPDAELSHLSPYDDFMKKYGKVTGVDWRLLSSIAYQESQYFMGASSRNAHGLMQIKERTARQYGVDDIYDPELNIKAGTLHFSYLMSLYSGEGGIDSLNVIKFALASYNAGEGRIAQFREKAAKAGYDACSWESVQAYVATDKSLSFSGRQTSGYVDEILSRYEKYKNLIE